MGSLLSDIASASSSLTKGAAKVVTLANSVVAIGIIGSTANTLVGNPLLNTAFGEAKGALLSIVALLISHAASQIAAYGAPAGGTALVAAAVPAVPPAPANAVVTEETLRTKVTTPVPPATS